MLVLVKCVAVWVLMLKHIQAPHTDALKTHFTQNISAALLECEKVSAIYLLVAGLFRVPASSIKERASHPMGQALGCVVEPISVLSIAVIQQKHFVTSGL